MSTNRELRKIFEQLGAGLELLGANPFRANAHHRAARTVGDLGRDLREIVEEDRETAMKRLEELPGIGEGTARRIVEYVDTGAIAEHSEMLEKVPESLFEVLQVPGLGPKTVKLMWDNLGISSLEELSERLDDPELLELPRMGEKTIENIRQAIAFSRKAGGRVPLGIARPMAERIVEELESTPGVQQIAFAGSVRRGRETIGDVDVLVACRDPETVRLRFVELPFVEQVLASGESKSSVRIEYEGVPLQADLRIVPEESWGAALMYFTGSKEHNVALRQRAIRQDKHLNEFGLFSGTEERPQERGERPLAADNEEAIYRELDLDWIPPELREEAWRPEEIDEKLVETLVTVESIRSELHSHTDASDGRHSIDELAAKAKRRGLKVLGITDHSVSQTIANGLDADRLRRHAEAIREANEKIAGIELLAGTEVDILPDGSLDYDDDVLAELDLVVASPHAALRQDPKTATERLLRAIAHPAVHVLGHPTGRLIGKREGLSPDIEALVETAAEHDVALELNANWRRLDLRDSHLRLAMDRGCKIAIDTDAHKDADFDLLRYGVLTARRAGVTKQACVNCWTPRKLRSWLSKKTSA